jgi:hypothetical protein
MNRLYRKWLKARGIKIPSMVREIEISPLFALAPEDIPHDLEVPAAETVFLAVS